MTKAPIGDYGEMASAYARQVDTKPIHIYYERPTSCRVFD